MNKSIVSSVLLRRVARLITVSTLLPLHQQQTQNNQRLYSLANKMQLEKLNFDNLALRSLPIDSEKGSRQRKVVGACFSLIDPTPLDGPETVAVSTDALSLLDIKATVAETLSDRDFPEYFSGNKLLPGSQTAAHCYCGHQFGYFSGQLGDGCASYLGEIVNKKRERWEIQLKGSGKTPYSRRADGRKVLRSSIREFLCSEAMHYLGVPTTRAGSCVTSDTKVVRDLNYDGNQILERATVILRIAPTFLRFGSFELFKPLDPQTGREGSSVGRKDVLDQLLDYTIKTFFPQVWKESSSPESREDILLEFYKEVLRKTARLVAKWQCLGWCHGVLNTDNMSIMGLTIDYGPYGFMDTFDPGFICNGSDDGGRYSYENQPKICRWNCLKLGEAIKLSLPLEKSKPAIKVFDEEYDRAYIGGMRNKLGLRKELEGDMDLIASLLSTMYGSGCDFTNGFRSLADLLLPGAKGFEESKATFLDSVTKECTPLHDMLKSYKPKIPPGQIAMFQSLVEQQPQLAEALKGQLAIINVEMKKQEKFRLLKEMTSDSKAEADRRLWTVWRDKYVGRLEKELEGGDVESLNRERQQMLGSSNPCIVLRNYVAQDVIEMAERGDFSGVRSLLELLRKPYAELSGKTEAEKAPEASVNQSLDDPELCALQQKYGQRPPAEITGITVT